MAVGFGIRKLTLTVSVVSFCFSTSFGKPSDNVQNQLSGDELVINRKYSKNDEIPKESKGEGQDMILHCEYTAASGSSMGNRLPEAFEWKHNGVAIKETSPSARVCVLEKSKPNGRTLTLIMRNLHSNSDTGLYECSIIFDEVTQLKRKIEIVVTKRAFWEDNQETVAGTVGQPLEINCVARGQPQPDVTIQILDGLQEDKDYIMIEKQKILIQELTMSHRGLKVQCIATQSVEGLDDNPMSVKVVTIDVTYAPEFDFPEQTLFGIKGERLTLPCIVKNSNPSVRKFEFAEQTANGIFTDITDNDRNYKIETDLIFQAAYLHILALEDRHFDISFECRAYNGLPSTKKFLIRKRHPPALPFPSPSDASSENKVVWKLLDGSEQSESVSPVVKYKIRFLSGDHLSNETDPNQAPQWEDVASMKEFDKKETDLYSIENLNKSTLYYFRFKAINKAGESSWSPAFKIATKARIASDNKALNMKWPDFINILCSFFVVIILSKFA